MANQGGSDQGEPGNGGNENNGDDGAPAAVVRRFLVGLATDPARLGSYIMDPDAELEAAGIDPQSRLILKSGNPAAIHGLLQGTAAPAAAAAPLVVDVAPGGSGQEQQVTVRAPADPTAGASFWPIRPNLVINPQIHPQLVIQPQLVVNPQIHPNLVVQPQIMLMPIHPQMVTPPQVEVFGQQNIPLFPQLPPIQFPPVTLQIHPQIHPQITFPQIFPQIHPQMVAPPQVHPQITFPQTNPQSVAQGFFPPPLQLQPVQFPPLQLSPLQFPLQLSPVQFPLQLSPVQFPLQIPPMVWPR